jgi:hypothetical protein
MAACATVCGRCSDSDADGETDDGELMSDDEMEGGEGEEAKVEDGRGLEFAAVARAPPAAPKSRLANASTAPLAASPRHAAPPTTAPFGSILEGTEHPIQPYAATGKAARPLPSLFKAAVVAPMPASVPLMEYHLTPAGGSQPTSALGAAVSTTSDDTAAVGLTHGINPRDSPPPLPLFRPTGPGEGFADAAR